MRHGIPYVCPSGSTEFREDLFPHPWGKRKVREDQLLCRSVISAKAKQCIRFLIRICFACEVQVPDQFLSENSLERSALVIRESILIDLNRDILFSS